MKLSYYQQELYDFIVEYFTANQVMPTLREMMKGLGLASPAPIQARLLRLKRKGAIEYIEGRKGAFRLTGYRVQLVPEVVQKSA